VNDHPHSGGLGFPPQAEKQKYEGASIVAFVTARKAPGLKQTIDALAHGRQRYPIFKTDSTSANH
jgi:hypothetical protein